MTRYAGDGATSITFPIHCPFCKNGKMTEHNVQIAPFMMAKHLKEHAYMPIIDPATNRKSGREVIGADCDCPRIPIKTTRDCLACRGQGTKQVTIAVDDRVKLSKKGAKHATALDLDLDKPGIVTSINDAVPDWEGDVITVTWDLTDRGRPRKHWEGFMFMLEEVEKV